MLIITGVDTGGHASDLALHSVRNTCPLLSLHLIILEYGLDQFKNEVVNHDMVAKITGLSCIIYLFSY